MWRVCFCLVFTARSSPTNAACVLQREAMGETLDYLIRPRARLVFLIAGCRVMPMLRRQQAMVRLSIVITLISVAYLLQQAGAPLQPAVISGIGSTYKYFLHSLVDALCSCAVATVLLCAAGVLCVWLAAVTSCLS